MWPKKTTKDKKELLLKKAILIGNGVRELQLKNRKWLTRGNNPLSMENCANEKFKYERERSFYEERSFFFTENEARKGQIKSRKWLSLGKDLTL